MPGDYRAPEGKVSPLTSEKEKNMNEGGKKRIEIRNSAETDDIEPIREGDAEDPAWLKKLDGDGPVEDAENAAVGQNGAEPDPALGRSGRKKSGKSAENDLVEHLARKNDMLQKLRERLEETEKLVVAKEDRLVRLAAEFENYKKRTSREWDLLKNQANAGLMTEILGVLDDLDRAFEHSGDSVEHFMEGISLIHTSLVELLKRNGLTEIESVGKPFDPQYHEAIAEMSSEEIEAGHVAEVVQKGYMLNDQVIRPAKVVVSRGSDE
jgi:molecular chaperone GrpE